MYEAQIKRGAEFLDAQWGIDWPTKINVSQLDMSSNERCVLGQLYGGYFKAYGQFHWTKGDSEAHGFIPDFDTNDFRVNGTQTLRKEWQNFITKRLDELNMVKS